MTVVVVVVDVHRQPQQLNNRIDDELFIDSCDSDELILRPPDQLKINEIEMQIVDVDTMSDLDDKEQ